jgi:REP element-mobilizing transposase RayT
MTTARSLLVDPDAPGFYHCISRCVRRAWLCGVDPYDGKSYEHRRAWVEQRVLELAEIFAVGVYAYSVMSNHVHVVLRIDPTTAATWTDEEVATRWVRLFPATVNGAPDEAGCRTKEQTLLGNADQLITCRQRLGSLAWFMKALNEPIARRANREDACTGRFWQGRYTCQSLLDDAAVLTCMSYVDLNPIRAGIAENLESSAHTSAVQRIEKVRSNPSTNNRDIQDPSKTLHPKSEISYRQRVALTSLCRHDHCPQHPCRSGHTRLLSLHIALRTPSVAVWS